MRILKVTIRLLNNIGFGDCKNEILIDEFSGNWTCTGNWPVRGYRKLNSRYENSMMYIFFSLHINDHYHILSSFY